MNSNDSPSQIGSPTAKAQAGMARMAIGFGVSLILLAVLFFVLTWSPTSLIPAAIGLPLLICGAIALNEAYRKHAMHAAAAFGLIGALLVVGAWMGRGIEEYDAAFIEQALMLLLCLLFVGLCVRSFISARRRQRMAEITQE